MSEQKHSTEQPYQSLGLRLRKMRQKSQESAAEVSGAVEIDTELLERIEQGVELPSEDILMLLISHFGLGDDEAVTLWELAGYDHHQINEEPRMTKQPVVLLALESRVVYSNGMEVVADKNGVVMNFTQHVDQSQGAVPVARVGMSYEQAESVLSVLQKALMHGKYSRKPKALPASSHEPKTKGKRRPNQDSQR